ncbi:large ribosomal subunit protein mL64 [Alligator mississippiensis]|nr:large ribosomal subunit protein mL64 [Alligator mississippiensis]
MAAPMERACSWLLRAATPARGYRAGPLKYSLGGVYQPDPDDPSTPKWQLQPAYKAKMFGRYGSASGVDPARLWPSPEQLREMEAEEREWYPGLREMEAALDEKEREEKRQRVQREKLIKAKMAKMPQLIAEWQQEKAARKQQVKEEKAQRARLVAKAHEHFGNKVNPSSPQFQELVQELDRKERKERKLLKKQQKEAAEQAAAKTPAPVSAGEDLAA